MKLRMTLFMGLASLPVALVALVAGCTVDANIGSAGALFPETGLDVNRDGADAAPATDAPSVDDARDGAETDDAAPAVDAGCGVSHAQQGGWVSLEVRQQVEPPAMGGTLLPGRYALSAYRSYLNGPMGTAEARETVELTGSPSVGAYARLSEVRNTTGDLEAHGPRGEQLTYTTESAIFMRRRFTCPAKPVRNADRYSATATTITIIDTEDHTERIYERLP